MFRLKRQAIIKQLKYIKKDNFNTTHLNNTFQIAETSIIMGCISITYLYVFLIA